MANHQDIINVRSLNGKGSIQNLSANQVSKLLVYVNCDKLVKEEYLTNNSRNVSDIKITHGSRTLPKLFRKQIRN